MADVSRFFNCLCDWEHEFHSSKLNEVVLLYLPIKKIVYILNYFICHQN